MQSAADPIARFQEVLGRAGQAAPYDHVAVTLATVNAEGQPSARVVLLRGVDSGGFVFFTNYDSRKARDLAGNSRGAICCYWPWIDEQVRIEGLVSRIAASESDAYFAGRPRGSQVGAWASRQSEPLATRTELERRYEAVDAEYEGREIPRPPFWGGYRLAPHRIEFWRAGPNRLHDRLVFIRAGTAWRTESLYP